MPGLLELHSSSQYRDAMARMPSAISIVTTNGPGGKWGTTVSAICSVSDSPPMILICLNRENRANAIIKKNMVLAVNVLSDNQFQFSSKFASKSPDALELEFTATHWKSYRDVLPVLGGAAVNLVGKVDRSIEVASHTVFFVLVELIATYNESMPIVYFDRNFHSVKQIR